MAIRPSWQGHLRLSLVTCGVALYPTSTSGSDIHFHLINPVTNNRIKMVTTDAGTGEPVERRDLVKGYEIEKDTYVLLDDEDFKAVRLESTKVIDIEHFVPAEEIDRLYLDKPYCLAPEGKVGADAFAVIRDAMKQSGQVAVGRVVLSTRERLVALEPRGDGILATILRSGDDVRDVGAIFDSAPAGKPDREMIEIAQRIIAQKSTHFDPDAYVDRYEEALREIIKKKSQGQRLVRAPEPESTNVIDLMEALQRSLGANSAPRRDAQKKPRAAASSGPAPKRVRKAPAKKRGHK
jgi:DNA end-binding protein Ku